jgi:CheY-like chemotaxis protein
VHILVVEDDVGSRKAMERVLRNAGHTVCWSETGRGALELLRTEPIELVLLDMMLPDVNGWEITRSKLANPKIADIPVIIMSGLSSEEIRRHSESNPVTSAFLILSKPPDIAQLLKAIEHIAELRGIAKSQQ